MDLLDARELAPYLDEPKQLASGMVGKDGVLEMRFERRGDRSVLADLYRRAPLLVQRALYWDEAMPGLPGVFIITTSGCVLQGDRMAISIEMGPDAQAHVTTQAATKIHEMDANFAAQTQELTLDEGSYLELLPFPLIPHKHSRFISQTHITIAPSATLLYSEIVMGGRKHHGNELFEYDLYSAEVNARRPDGEELFAEKLLSEPARYPVRSPGAMGDFDVFGNAFVLTPKDNIDRIIDRTDAGRAGDGSVIQGASRLPNDAGIVFKVLGVETEPARQAMRDFWAVVRETVLDRPIPPLRVWG